MRRHLAAAGVALGVLLGAGPGVAAADTPKQAVQQAAGTFQSADSSATSIQAAPKNSAISVRIGSPGDGGAVSQSNGSLAGAAAGNLASTNQQATQTQPGGGNQAADQAAKTIQSADADATSTQVHPSNEAISVRIGSPGNDGSVDQSNHSAALAKAGNAARTTQDATQQAGGSCGSCGGGSIQAAEQAAKTEQSADADATSKQIDPRNSAISVRLHSPGNDGSVEQSNTSAALAKAGNAADTTQTADQDAGSGSGSGVQALDQEAATLQGASSDATSKQIHPSNEATSVRHASPGDGGSVDQSNKSAALSFAGNLAHTHQDASQTQSSSDGCGACGGDRVQAVGQFAFTGQWAGSHATSEQFAPSNSATSVRLGHDHGGPCGCHGHGSWAGHDDGHGLSAGNDGSVSQINGSAALSAAANLARTDQSVDQTQGWDGSAGSAGVQAVGQFAKTGQRADSDASSAQLWPSNDATAVRLGSAGSNGSVEQANLSLAKSLAFNLAFTDQSVRQLQ